MKNNTSVSRFELPERLTFETSAPLWKELSSALKKAAPGGCVLDFSRVRTIDSAGVALIDQLHLLAVSLNRPLHNEHLSDEIRQTLERFHLKNLLPDQKEKKVGFFELLGQKAYDFFHELYDSLVLVSNIFYWGFAAFFKTKLRRRGETIRQSLQIGVSALPIIGLISFLIGFILALQSAVQLRQFGANIYVADLVAVAMVSEMGPLITAIMVAGRSGSAIAAEIGTMKVSEEMDALHVMGIDPIPYLIVPKLYAIVLTLPLLTVMANIIGIIGGMVIGITYLNLDIIPFYNEVISVLRYKEIVTFLVKSVTFAVIIVVTGAYFGLKVKGGAEGVGKMTTAAVVTSIFLVIVADSILGLIFYFGEPPF